MQLSAWVDGACEPRNPGGTATYGMVVKDPSGRVLESQGGVIAVGPEASNNVGEYGGLLRFVEWMIARRYKQAVVYSDSRLLINQMIGDWRVKGGLYAPFHAKVVGLIAARKLKLVFCWVPREENQEADALSKKALADAGVQLRIQRE